MAKRNDWTEEQVTIVLYEYCRKPFGQFSGTKPFIVELAKMFGRSPGAIVRKVGNLASLDPKMKARGVDGLDHVARADKVVWDRYFGHWDLLAFDAERLIANYRNLDFEQSITIEKSDLPQGRERIQEIKRRINQDFFRQTVLSSYRNKCCITGINNTALLNACHISDWSQDEENRTNPQNGLCMNVFFHKAYDEFLIGISPDYKVYVSDKIFGSKPNYVAKSTIDYIKNLDGQSIILPQRFLPDRDLLAQHFDSFRQNMAL